MDTVTIAKGDEGYVLTFTVNDSAGSAYNLTGYTVTFMMWLPGVPGSLLVTTACTVTDAANGICTWLIADTNIDTPGTFHCKLELTKTGVIESTEVFELEVVQVGGT